MRLTFVILCFLLLFQNIFGEKTGKSKKIKYKNFLGASSSSSLAPSFEDNVTSIKFRKYAFSDNSNENIGCSTVQEIISRSGFNYENHYVASDDGYITQLVRVVNPLADRTKLKQPPVMMMHGGIIGTITWIWASSIQHHPEKYPRSVSDGPITSWNRSLAFVLANNGHDVWLVSIRGSSKQNKAHKKYSKQFTSLFNRDESKKSIKNNDDRLDLSEMIKYWNYSMDEIISFELPQQMDKILQLTGAKNVSLIALSLSSQISLAMMASDPAHASKVHNYVVFAPILNNIGTNNFMKTFHTIICRHISDEIGSIFFSELLLSGLIRDILLRWNKSKYLRYSLIKALEEIVTGPSGKYQTLLEQGVVGHLLMPIGFKQLKHHCQQVEAGRLQKFDYGPLRNQAQYGSLRPPIYDIGKIELSNWLLVSGGNDNLATMKSVQQLISSIKKKPFKHIHVERFNHLDLVAAIENDILINLPVLEYLDRFHLPSLSENNNHNHWDGFAIGNSINSMSKTDDLEKFVPIEPLNISNILEGHMRHSFGMAPSYLS